MDVQNEPSVKGHWSSNVDDLQTIVTSSITKSVSYISCSDFFIYVSQEEEVPKYVRDLLM